MKSLLLSLFLASTILVSAQTQISGVVLDAEKGTPLPGASIFLSNTSIGTTANDKGRFELFIPAGKFDLIVTVVGFETYSQTINGSSASGELTIRMKIKSKVMETVVVEQFEKDGWAKWGNFFLEQFIGGSEHAKQCTIKNPEVLRFRHDKKEGTLTAIALEPLLVENKSLGYLVRYQLEEFNFNFSSRLLLYAGFPFFEQMQGSKNKMEKWEDRRKKVYEGSIMHFMRSLYRNQLAADGFKVWRLVKVPNIEKQRVREVYRQSAIKSGGRSLSFTSDSSDYYSKILRQPDETDKIVSDIIPGDSIAFAIDSTVAGLHFENYLLIHYPKGKAPSEYVTIYPKNGNAMLSQLKLISNEPVEVYANGMYFNPTNLLSLGYWAWAEKMATMLPFDYKPSSRN